MVSTKMRLVYAVLIGLIPVIATIVVVRFVHQTSLYQHVPANSDEIMYWRQTQTFMAAGFQGGYYTWSEQPARATFSHFYAHGPVFPALSGLLASLTGWYLYSGPFLNLFLLFLAVSIFILVAQPDRKQLVFLALTLLTFWPMLMFSTATMQESLNLAIAILLAAFFSIRFFSASSPRWVSAAILATLFVGALFRPTWSLAAVLLFLIPTSTTKTSVGWLLAGLMKTLIFVALMFGLATYWSASYPDFSTRFITSLSKSLGDGFNALFHNTVRNLYLVTQGNPLEILQRVQILGLLLLTLIARSRTQNFRRFRTWITEKTSFTTSEILFHLLSIGLMFAFNIVIYDVFAWRDYRVLASYLLLSLLMLLSARRYNLMLLIIVSNILFLPAFITYHKEFNGISYTQDSIHLQEVEQIISQYIPVRDSQPVDNGWCRTVLVQGLPVETLVFPKDVGISFFIYPETITAPIRSQYLLMNADDIDQLPGTEPFEALVTFDNLNLTLFHNNQSDCDQ